MKSNFNFFEALAIIHSCKKTRTVKIIDKVGDNDYRAEYKGFVYTAIYNPFVGQFYVDDKFGFVGKAEEVTVHA